jgi:starch-binding outer membrane protein, SusD/RagB family
MKTKYKLLNIFFTIVLLLVISCDNYLDIVPTSSYSAGGFYESQNDFELAINGAYTGLQDLYNGIINQILSHREDICQNDFVNNYDFNHIHRFQNDASNNMVRSAWRIYWEIINQSNAILDNIDNANFDDDAYRSYYKGEAYFLRAFAYYHLGFLFGGVPLIDCQTETAEIEQIPRSTQDETFVLAADDFLKAAGLLPQKWEASKLGRATKYAAEGMCARLYMFQGKYSDAKPLLQDIINSGNYQMAANYGDCFVDQYDNSPEHVFQVQYVSGMVGQGNRWVAQELDENYLHPLFPWGGRNPSAWIISPLFYDSYEVGDLRRDFSMQKGFDLLSGERDDNSIFLIKYSHGTQPTAYYDYEVNMPVLRYTDVKLMYAEVLNEESYNPNGEAFTIINQVRSRAGLTPITSSIVTSKEAFRDAILKERNFEFVGEYLRWYDLLRTGKAVSVINEHFKHPEEGGGIFKMEEYHKIFPIPQYELDVNKNRDVMWQNPGY